MVSWDKMFQHRKLVAGQLHRKSLLERAFFTRAASGPHGWHSAPLPSHLYLTTTPLPRDKYTWTLTQSVSR